MEDLIVMPTASASQVRAWARQNGILVSHRGPLREEVWRAWESSGGGRLPVAASDRDLEHHPKKVKGLAERRQNRLSRPTAPYEERHQTVLRAAAATFRDMGYQAAKLGDVADRAGINRSSIYYYFATKEDILIELISGPLERNLGRMEALMRTPIPIKEKVVRTIGDLMASFDAEYPALSIYFEERFERLLADSTSEAHRVMLAMERRYMQLWRQLLEEGRRSGELSFEGSAKIASFAVLGVIVYTSRWYRARGELSAPEVGELYSKLLLQGLLPRL